MDEHGTAGHGTPDERGSGFARAVRRGFVLLALGVVLAGCAGALDPAGPVAARRRTLFLVALAVAAVVVLVVVALTVAALRRGEPPWDGSRLVVVGGLVVPTVVLMAVMGYSFTVLATEVDGDEPVTVEVVGHQYWWEVRYPDSDVVTANEVHVPAGVPVRFVVSTVDVLHSVWVPALGGKIDMVPGRTNEIVLQADEPGRYQGHCTEFCGLQHAKMRFHVVAEDPDEFDAWLAEQAEPASFATAEAEQAFRENSCAACHAVRGTGAVGQLGPDLTHFASRERFAAGTLVTERETLRQWIVEAQALKEGALMPNLPQARDDADLLVDQLLALE